MKINGQTISGPNIEVIPIPRGDGRLDIVFKAKAVLDFTVFDKLCPQPKPGTIQYRGGEVKPNIEDKDYQTALSTYSLTRTNWLVLESLKATEGLEWETVKADDPTTWVKYSDELRASGISEVEMGRILSGVMIANCLDERKIEEARNRFFRAQQEQQRKSSSPMEEQLSMPSGVPVNGTK